MAANLPVVTWDYDFSPYGQKIRILLKALNVDFFDVDQPVTLPRPDLEALGITYRRIPVTSIGKDVYCDSAAIVAAVQRVHGLLPASQADKAYELWGINVFNNAMPVVPPDALTPEFLQDRATIYPILLSPNLAAMRPSAVAEMRAHMQVIEHSFLRDDAPFIAGHQLGLPDIHVVWSIRWVLFTLELRKEPGCGPDAFPKLYQWIERFPSIDTEKTDAKKASEIILGSPYVQDELPFDDHDPLGISKGTQVQIENRDTTEGAHPQAGRLIGLSSDELVIELENGIRLHFPRTGYNVFKSKN